ncbi:hypothetical protein ACFQ05_11870 [Amycolatopsis umgeniensis]|uniref:Uncharacterized protein n=1 Tax=Amycolatopsis umgeniensis TaxID=336628 RepID=A0A841B3U5_9PSEU|nr:hypothetical protein [Amycolatopsis umgeniensis]MBB5853997.1 hypothetical protein [Amycolatopsis umgeniensis]
MALVALFLRVYVFASSAGRHALGVDVANGKCCVVDGLIDVGEVVYVPVVDEIIDQCELGLTVNDDFPTGLSLVRPYLEHFYLESEKTIEFAAIKWFGDDEFESVSGQLELVA